MSRAAPSDHASLVSRFRDVEVAVVGDICLDRYVVGRPSRMSREAPVVVLEWTREYSLPGEASNPALNVAALGGRACLVGLTGHDATAEELSVHLRSRGVVVDYLVADAARITTEKTRILAEGLWVLPQQLARVDRLDRVPISAALQEKLCSHIEELGPRVHALLLSDYKNGVVSERVIECALRSARRHGKLITVDSQGDLYRFAGFDCVRCNRAEAEAVLGTRLETDEDFERELRGLSEKLECRALVVTRDAEGISVYSRSEGYQHVPACPVQVADVVGAGDTVIAVLTLALAAGESFASAAFVANRAAALVVQHVGNACPTPDELRRALSEG